MNWLKRWLTPPLIVLAAVAMWVEEWLWEHLKTLTGWMAKFPLIRHYRESSGPAEKPQAKGKGAWQPCTPDAVGGFSAALYFFGREIHREVGVPVGLINTSVGGTPIES